MNKEMREKREEFEKIFHVEFKEPQKLESCGKEALTQLINQANKKEAISGIPSGFTKLDDITGGFQGGDLTIIAGRPMMGKTSLALSMARQMAVDHHIPVLFATFEMKETVVSKRLIAAQCDVPLHSMVCAIVNPDQWKDIDKKVAPLVESPITIADIYEYGLEQLELMCRKAVEKDHVKAIFIDSLEFIYSADYFILAEGYQTPNKMKYTKDPIKLYQLEEFAESYLTSNGLYKLPLNEKQILLNQLLLDFASIVKEAHS